MTTRLLVEATDVAGAPLRGARADAAVDGSTAFAPLQPSADGLELEITGATHVDLKVVANGFWEVFQALDIGPADTACVPGYTGVTLHNASATEPAFLFVADEAPLHRKLGVYEVRA